jgi:hypothetical protein
MPQHPRLVVCIRNTGYLASLELRKLYQVVDDPEGEKDQMIRVIDESGEDYLYPLDMFVVAPLPEAVEEAVCKPPDRRANSPRWSGLRALPGYFA